MCIRDRDYRENDSIRAGVVEVEMVKEIGDDIGDGLMVGFKEKP